MIRNSDKLNKIQTVPGHSVELLHANTYTYLHFGFLHEVN